MKSINQSHFENIPTSCKHAKGKYTIHAVIETPGGLRHKYEFDPDFGIFKLKSTISEGLSWPYDYGFIPQTLGADKDPLDILFLVDERTFAGCLVHARILGIVRLLKNGVENDRIIGCADRLDGIAQSTDPYDSIDDLPEELLRSIVRFLTEYSEEQDNTIKFRGVASRKKALAAIRVGAKAFSKRRGKAKK